jgi:large subunit ribosomal protein L19e
MVDISYQRRMAARILKCGRYRVWIDPDQLDEVSEAVTRGDIRRLICYRVIQVRQKQGVSRGRTRATMIQKAKGRRTGPGSRRGRKYARAPRKRNWIRTIRPLRAELKTLREEGKLDRSTYRMYYRKARGNMFKSRAHLLTHLTSAGVLSEGEAKIKITAKEKARKERDDRQGKAQAARSRVRQKAAEARALKETDQMAVEGSGTAEPDEEAIEAKGPDASEDAPRAKKADRAKEPKGATDAPGDDEKEVE